MKKKLLILFFLACISLIGIENIHINGASEERTNGLILTGFKTDSLIKNEEQEFIPASNKEKHGWNLVFSDEFSGTKINQKKWVMLDREKNYNNELQAYTPDNVKIQNGRLLLTGDKEKKGYTSGLVQTKGKFEFLYGKVEVRANYPSGKGLFPAIWLLRSDGKDALPEIDIFEAVGHEPEKAYFVQHWREKGKLQSVHGTKVIQKFNEDHIFGIEWDEQEIKWFIDNQLVYKAKNYDAHVPMYLIINLAIGGNWPGNPNALTVFPADFSIDYVKIYEKER